MVSNPTRGTHSWDVASYHDPTKKGFEKIRGAKSRSDLAQNQDGNGAGARGGLGCVTGKTLSCLSVAVGACQKFVC